MSLNKLPSTEFMNTQFLTGLRAYAALSVFFIHSEGLGLRNLEWKTPIVLRFLNNMINFGKYGVIVFFVLSAYTIALSLQRSSKFQFIPYIARRLLRILPMYYLMILIAFAYGGIPDYFKAHQVTNSWYNLFAHLSFINLFQTKYRNNLLGVEWSVPIELFYYLLLPYFFVAFKKIRGFGIQLFLLSLCVVLILPVFIPTDQTYHWSVTKYLFSFSTGTILHHIIKDHKSLLPQLSSVMLAQLFLLLLVYISTGAGHHEEFITLWTGAIIIAANSRSSLSKWLFENRVVIFLGNLSYSFYLIHFPILIYIRATGMSAFASGILTLLISVGLSYLSFTIIERPCINYGHRRWGR
ncbi:MAG: acyltransferase [Bdellovibrionota bacterium]